MRPSCEDLMNHDYFNDFRDWFEDEIQTLIEYDNSEQYGHNGKSSMIGAIIRSQIQLPHQ
jgi:predicted ATP-binding protein involved in virulence